MKILITGSSGHLGEALVRVLKSMNYETISIDIKPSAFTDKVGSITERAFVKENMKGVDVVLHTATLHKPHIATHSKQNFLDTNVTGTLNLLEEAVLARVQAFIFTSTTSTFGDAMSPASDEWNLAGNPNTIFNTYWNVSKWVRITGVCLLLKLV